MTEDIIINGKYAYAEWGIWLDEASLAALMTPPPMKEYLKSSSRLKDGDSYIGKSPKVASREVTVILNMSAASTSELLAKYTLFCNELVKGEIDIETRYQPGIIYRMRYLSCSQYQHLLDGIAVFSLKLVEPDPTNRTKI